MYSPFSLSTRRNFVTQELTREYLSLPDEIDELYSGVIKWLSNLDGMTDFDKTRNVDLDSHQMTHTGRQFSQFLPAHTMKVYRTLLEVEYKAINEKNSRILDQPHILIIDDGCGGGTASIALISLIVHYQKYRLAHKLPIFPVKIDFLGIDINDNALKIYGIFLTGCIIRLKDLLIDIKTIKTFRGTLPQNTPPIIEWITEQDRIHSVILALANIFRPLQKEYEEAIEVRRSFASWGLSSLLFNRLVVY